MRNGSGGIIAVSTCLDLELASLSLVVAGQTSGKVIVKKKKKKKLCNLSLRGVSYPDLFEKTIYVNLICCTNVKECCLHSLVASLFRSSVLFMFFGLCIANEFLT